MTNSSTQSEGQIQAEKSNQMLKSLLPGLLGIHVVEIAPERAVAEVVVRDNLKNVLGMAHGATLAALADTCTAQAAIAAARPNRTVTLEMKINFVASIRHGKAIAEAKQIHKGGRTMVYQTSVRDEGGRLLAITTSTYSILEPE